MQKKSTITAFWLTIMKVSAIHILMTVVLTGTVLAHSSAQELLNRSVTLSCNDLELKRLLERVSEATKVPITYNSSILPKSHKVSASFINKNLADVLNQLLNPLGVSYVIVLDQIILRKDKRSEPPQSFPQSSTDMVPIELRIQGIVRDEKGDGLPGVNVVLKGTQQGTVTDVQGRFKMEVPDAQSAIVFSFVGYLSQEIVVGNRNSLELALLPDVKSLEEMVVIGYGEVSRKDLTGSIGTVNINDMMKAPVPSFDEALAGRVAGVQVTSSDGQPGSLPNIVIRGANSLTQDNSPLYVVDGFPIEGNDNGAINPSDIESLDILKDASATAIYGARGANGVIIITTKRGKLGAPTVAYNSYYGFQKDVKRIKLMDPYEFVKFQLEMRSGEATNKYLTEREMTLEDYKSMEGVNWYEKVLRTAPMQSHSISLSGGTSKSKYSVSGSYLGQKGIFLNTGFNRYQGRVTLDQHISDNLKVGLNLNYSRTGNYGAVASSGSGSASLMYSIWSYRPIFTDPSADFDDLQHELLDPEINPAIDYRTNPILQLENELRERFSDNMLTNAYLEYIILKGLKLRITGGFNKTTSENNTFNNSKTRTGNPVMPQYKGINGSQSFGNNTNFTNENTLSWSKSIGKDHQVNTVAGYTQQKGTTSTFGAAAVMISDESLGLSGLDTGTPTAIDAGSSGWALHSFLGRVNYNYKSKYLLTASMRADGSSKFAKGNRWGYFPSVALAYRLGSEDFMKNLRFISDSKIRLSYGATGNNRVGDFSYLSSIVTNPGAGYPFGNTHVRGTYPSRLGNVALKWETTRQFNAGIDFGMLGDRVTFTGDYYYKKTNDLLLNAQLPHSSGYTSAYKNIGSVSNSGIELAINTVNIAREGFSWHSSFNISFNRNKVLSLTDNQEALTTTVGTAFSNIAYVAKIGMPIAMFYGPAFDGLYQYEDFDRLTNGTYMLKSSQPTNGNSNRAAIKPGWIRYKDIDHDNLINQNDYTVTGNPNPDFIGGFNNNFEYKGFDLNIFLQFSYGNEIYNANRLYFEGGTFESYNTNAFASYANRWTEENPSGTIPRMNGQGANVYSGLFVEDGSFLRLKTLSLGYNIKDKWLTKIKVKTARIYFSAQNLFTLTGYSGIDPEVSTRHSALTPGMDWSPFPRMRTTTFGLNLTF
jgi:TonB-dependent starch-binding outer membrane protein SusC